MLTVGLRPHSSFSNQWVEFDPSGKQTVFKHYGLATGELQPSVSSSVFNQSFVLSMTTVLHEAPDNRFQILAQIDSPNSSDPLIIGQWRARLIVLSGRDFRNEKEHPRVSTNLIEHIGTSVDIEIIFTSNTTKLLVNELRVAEGPAIPFTKEPSRITVGNAPDGLYGWAGSMRAFSIESTLADSLNSQFLFDKNDFPMIRNSAGSRYNLKVPRPGKFPDRNWIGSLRIDQLFKNNVKDIIINFLGFMPFGFLASFLLAFRVADIKHQLTVFPLAVLTVGLCGLLFSLSIEITQAYIPGRSPHVHDVILNSLGATGGALCLYFLLRLGFVRIQSQDEK